MYACMCGSSFTFIHIVLDTWAVSHGASVVLTNKHASSSPTLPLRDILRKPMALLKAADDG